MFRALEAEGLRPALKTNGMLSRLCPVLRFLSNRQLNDRYDGVFFKFESKDLISGCRIRVMLVRLVRL